VISATKAQSCLLKAADCVINYTIALANDGNMDLTNPTVTDPSASDLAPVYPVRLSIFTADMKKRTTVTNSIRMIIHTSRALPPARPGSARPAWAWRGAWG
jgi:hypothetical protein